MDFDSNNMVPIASAQVTTLTVAQVPMMPISCPICVSNGEKLEKFNGLNFKRWLFYLTTLNLASFLTEEALKLKENEHDIQVIIDVDLGNILTFYAGTTS